MRSIETASLQSELTTSCGTIILNKEGQILLCHVTGTNFWDIPKGRMNPGELPFQAAKRELFEETGLAFNDALFKELGGFKYQRNKRLHLYKLRAPETLSSLSHLRCTSYFSHQTTGISTPEMDGFRWASRTDIRVLCPFPMAECLLSLAW